MRRVLVCAVALLCCQSAMAQQAKLESFAFEGIALSSTSRDFRLRHPAAEYVASNSETASGLQCYCAKTASSDGTMFYFLDDRLYRIEIVYKTDRVEKMGGLIKVAEKMKAALGPPDDVQTNGNSGVFTWDTSDR